MKKLKLNPKSLEVVIDQLLRKKLLSYKQTNEDSLETGGVLMGEIYPKSNKIKITHILVGEHTSSSKYGVELNVKYLQKKIDEIWQRSYGTITYLGDWHTHPEIKPKPSFIDYKTFLKNYYSSQFNQNILLYMILGNGDSLWFKSFNGFSFKEINIKNSDELI